MTIFAKKGMLFHPMGFNPLFFNNVEQWAKATLEDKAKIVQEPKLIRELLSRFGNYQTD